MVTVGEEGEKALFVLIRLISNLVFGCDIRVIVSSSV